MRDSGRKADLPLTRRLAVGTSWALAGTAISQSAAFLGSVIYARSLGRESFGALTMVQSTAIATAGIASLGLGVIATRYVAAYKNSDPARAGRILALCSLLSGVAGLPFALFLLLAAGALPQIVLSGPNLGGLVRPAAVYVYFATLNGFQLGALAGLEAFRQLVTVNLCQAAVSLPLTFFLTSAFGLRGAVASFIAAAVFLWILQHAALQRECRLRGIRIDYKNALSERQIMGGFVAPCILSSVMGNCAIWCSYLLVARGRSGLLELGVFQAAYVLRSVVLVLPAQVTRVTTPILTNLWSTNSERTYGKLFWNNLRLNLLIAAVVASSFLLTGRYVLRLFGREFAEGSMILAILAAAAVAEVAASSLYQVLVSHGRMWFQAMVSALWSVTLVGVTALSQERGAAALAAAYLAAWVCSMGIYGVLAVRLIPRQSPIRAPALNATAEEAV